MTPTIPATEAINGSDETLLKTYNNLVQLTKDLMDDPSLFELDSIATAQLIALSQYYGRQCQEELKKRSVPFVRFFNWNNEGEPYGLSE